MLVWTFENSKELVEVSKPTRILDLETTSHDIRCIEAKTVMQGAHIVLVGWKELVQVFMVKTGGKDKAKVKKPTCEIKVGKSKVLKEIVGCEVLSDSRVVVIAGNNFQVERYELDLIEKDGSSFKSEIIIG